MQFFYPLRFSNPAEPGIRRQQYQGGGPQLGGRAVVPREREDANAAGSNLLERFWCRCFHWIVIVTALNRLPLIAANIAVVALVAFDSLRLSPSVMLRIRPHRDFPFLFECDPSSAIRLAAFQDNEENALEDGSLNEA